MTDRPRVVVVGAGILGASVAWHLRRAGAAVTVVEAGAPGGVATRGSLAWINASAADTATYFRLRHRSMADWRNLEEAVPGVRVAWGGALLWDRPADALDAFVRARGAWGYDVRWVTAAEAASREPSLARPPARAVHIAGEGTVEPLEAARALLGAAERLGATVRGATPVRALVRTAGTVTGVATEDGDVPGDVVVLAAGVATAALAAGAGVHVPLVRSPGLLALSAPQPPTLRGFLATPDAQMRQQADGRMAASVDVEPGVDGAAAAADVLAAMARTVRTPTPLVLDNHRVTERPMPADGLPLVGPAPGVPGLHVVVTHSGITLAPVLGRLVAEEILSGRRDEGLAPFGPERVARPASG